MQLDATLPAALLLAGFGDGASMFAQLTRTALAGHFRLIAVDLPGFGGRPALDGTTSLERLAEIVHHNALQERARIVVAHSLSSIVASLAARRTPSAIDTILSLEGNITAEDAYFSGTAADYSNAHEFRSAFLKRLDVLVAKQPIVARYRDSVATADPQALWELGCDARRFSDEYHPGEVLSESATICYLYNPENCPDGTLEWLRRSSIKRVRMENATHWKSVDQPELLSKEILQALQELGTSSGARSSDGNRDE